MSTREAAGSLGEGTWRFGFEERLRSGNQRPLLRHQPHGQLPQHRTGRSGTHQQDHFASAGKDRSNNNFIQTLAFVGSLSRTAETNSRGVQRLGEQLTHVPPEVRDRFVELAADMPRKQAAAETRKASSSKVASQRQAGERLERLRALRSLSESAGHACDDEEDQTDREEDSHHDPEDGPAHAMPVRDAA